VERHDARLLLDDPSGISSSSSSSLSLDQDEELPSDYEDEVDEEDIDEEELERLAKLEKASGDEVVAMRQERYGTFGIGFLSDLFIVCDLGVYLGYQSWIVLWYLLWIMLSVLSFFCFMGHR